MKKRYLGIFLSLVLMMTMLTLPVSAAEEIAGGKTASEQSLTIDQRRTNVTLSFPAAEYSSDLRYDIVFCMDASTSVETSNLSFSVYAEEMLAELVSYDAEVRVGVVKFKGQAFDTLKLVGTAGGLVEYTDETAPKIEEAIELNYKNNLTMAASGGSNIHGGLKLAESILDADAETAADHKFVILLTDGKTFIWNDANGNPVSNYTQWYKNHAIQNSGRATLNQTAGAADKSSYPANQYISTAFLTENGLTLPDVVWFDKYEDLYASENPELSGPTKYDMPCLYAQMGITPTTSPFNGSVKSYSSTNGAAVFPNMTSYRTVYEYTPNALMFSGITWFEANPFEYTKNEDGTVAFTGVLNPDFYMWHPDALMKALYKTGHIWTDLDEKYNTAVITYSGWGSGAGLSVAKSFCSWILDNADKSADIADADNVKTVFDSVRDQVMHQIEYVIDTGIVTDLIPAEFTLLMKSGNPFRIKVGAQELSGTKIAAVAESDDGIWAFGDAGADGSYPYCVDYVSATKTLKWHINVPVKADTPVSLTYTLEIDKDSQNGLYDTNVSAVLEYWSSTADPTLPGAQYTFPVPQVTYTVPEYTVTFKAGDHGRINDGIADISGTYRIYTAYPAIPSTTPDEDYEFLYWTDASGNTVTEFPETVTADAVYTAVWKTDLPDTGDGSRILLWIGLTMLSVSCLTFTVCRKRKIRE